MDRFGARMHRRELKDSARRVCGAEERKSPTSSILDYAILRHSNRLEGLKLPNINNLKNLRKPVEPLFIGRRYLSFNFRSLCFNVFTLSFFYLHSCRMTTQSGNYIRGVFSDSTMLLCKCRLHQLLVTADL